MPDVTINNLINYPQTSAKISDFKGKLLILDFWATSCSGCIMAMPALNKLQQQFKEQLVILPVTYEKSVKAKKFFSTNPWLKTLQLPSITSDTQLHQLFPHRLLPHEVWIGKEGRVIAVTGTEEINASNILKAIKGQGEPLKHKADVMNYNRNKPLLLHANGGGDTAFRFRSLVTVYIPGISGGTGIQTDTAHHTIRIYALNQTVAMLYTLAYPQLRADLPALRKDNVKFNQIIYPASADPSGKYCYEIILPDYQAEDAHELIRRELDSFFGVTSHLVPGTTGSEPGYQLSLETRKPRATQRTALTINQ